ncbi:hypothetical protein [Clostridium sp.]|nr:hypothetical protein [Clostridium sp.]
MATKISSKVCKNYYAKSFGRTRMRLDKPTTPAKFKTTVKEIIR